MGYLSQASTHLLWEQMKSKYKIFSQFVSRSVVFSASFANWSWEHMICLFLLSTLFSQVPKHYSVPFLPALKQFTKPKIRKEKKELSWLAGKGSITIMFLDVSSICYIVLAQKCANVMLSFWVFQVLGSILCMWKLMILRSMVWIPLLGPDPYSRCPCKVLPWLTPCNEALNCFKPGLYKLLPVHFYFRVFHAGGNNFIYLLIFKPWLTRAFIVLPVFKIKVLTQIPLLLSEAIWFEWLLSTWLMLRCWYNFQASVVFLLGLCSVEFLQLQVWPFLLQKAAHSSPGTKQISITRDLTSGLQRW